MTTDHGTADEDSEAADHGDGNAVKFRALAVSLRNGTGREVVESIADIVQSAPGNRRLLKRIEDLLAGQDKSILLVQYLWRNRATQLNDLHQLGRFMSLCSAAGNYDAWRPKLLRWFESGNAPPPRYSNSDALKTFAGLERGQLLDIFTAKYRGAGDLTGASLAQAAAKVTAGSDISYAYGDALFPLRNDRGMERGAWDEHVCFAIAADHCATDWDFVLHLDDQAGIAEHPMVKNFAASAIGAEAERPETAAFFRGLDTAGGLVLSTIHGGHFGLLKIMYERWMADHFVIKQGNKKQGDKEDRPNVIVTGGTKDTAAFAAIKALMKNRALLIAADGPPGGQASEVAVFEAAARFADGTPFIAYEARARTCWLTVRRDGEHFKPVMVLGPRREGKESFEEFKARWLRFLAARIEDVLSGDPGNLALRHQWQNYVRKRHRIKAAA